MLKRKGKSQMSFFSLFSKKTQPVTWSDTTRLAKKVGPRLDKLANEVFRTHMAELLDQPRTYVVPGIWGAKKHGVLTRTQKEIHEQVNPVLKEVLAELDLGKLTPEQSYAVEYLIRELLVYCLVFLREMALRGVKEETEAEKAAKALERMETIGEA